MGRIFSLLILLAAFSSCSMINTVALRTTANVIEQGSDEILTEGNWENFDKGVPANLKLLEGLWFSDQENTKLLTLLIKGYGAYGFAGSETKALKDIVLEEEDSAHVEQALLYYEKAIFYGVKYLELKGIKQDQFFDKAFPLKLKTEFDSVMDEDDYIALFYFAQSLGSSINLQRQNVSRMGYFSHVNQLLNYVCEKKPDLERGSCGLFQAALMAMMPSIMGGNQAKAKVMFKKLIKAQPYNLLARQAYIQFHLIPLLEEEEFEIEVAKLKTDIQVWFDLQKGKVTKKSKIYSEHREFNLFNSVAKKRLATLEIVKKEIF